MAETWVQQYADAMTPSADGKCVRLSKDAKDARGLIVSMPMEVWLVDYRFTENDRGQRRMWRRVR